MNRLNRRINWPREKRWRLWDRYSRWLLFRLKKYGPGPTISHEKEVANRKLQIEINKWNDLYKKRLENK